MFYAYFSFCGEGKNFGEMQGLLHKPVVETGAGAVECQAKGNRGGRNAVVTVVYLREYNLMTAFFASQFLVGLAICTDLLSFQFKERERVLFCLVISCILVSLHFMLLGHWTASCLGLLGCLRFTICCFTTSQRCMVVFLGISLVISLLTWEGILSLLSTAAVACNTVGAFRGNDRRLRELMFAGALLWLIHNLLAGSPTAVLLETIFISSNIVGYYRHYLRKPMGKPQYTAA